MFTDTRLITAFVGSYYLSPSECLYHDSVLPVTSDSPSPAKSLEADPSLCFQKYQPKAWMLYLGWDLTLVPICMTMHILLQHDARDLMTRVCGSPMRSSGF